MIGQELPSGWVLIVGLIIFTPNCVFGHVPMWVNYLWWAFLLVLAIALATLGAVLWIRFLKAAWEWLTTNIFN